MSLHARSVAVAAGAPAADAPLARGEQPVWLLRQLDGGFTLLVFGTAPGWMAGLPLQLLVIGPEGLRDAQNLAAQRYDARPGTAYLLRPDGHVAALRRLLDQPGSLTVNLGTGRGYSVLDVVKAYAAASGRKVPYRVVPRRPGDVAACWADPTRAAQLLGWRARHDLDRMCADSWRWQSLNPNGFDA
jgi:hypothetical protein